MSSNCLTKSSSVMLCPRCGLPKPPGKAKVHAACRLCRGGCGRELPWNRRYCDACCAKARRENGIRTGAMSDPANRSAGAKRRWRLGRGVPRRVSAVSAQAPAAPPKVYKRSPETRALMRAAMVARTARGENPAKGRPKSAEWKRKLAERCRAGLCGFKTIHAREYVRADGCRIVTRSGWEYLVAAHLDERRMDWEYEPEVLVSGEDVMLPDFSVRDQDGLRYIEVKGYLSPGAEAKLRRLQHAYRIELWDATELKVRGLLP